MTADAPLKVVGNDDPSPASLEAALNMAPGRVIDVVAHRHGRGPVDDIIVDTRLPEDRRFYVDGIDGLEPELVQELLNDRELDGRSVLQVVPHREGQVIEACIITVTPRQDAPTEWLVLEGDDYRQPLEDLLNEQAALGYSYHATVPHRRKAGNIPVVLFRRPR